MSSSDLPVRLYHFYERRAADETFSIELGWWDEMRPDVIEHELGRAGYTEDELGTHLDYEGDVCRRTPEEALKAFLALRAAEVRHKTEDELRDYETMGVEEIQCHRNAATDFGQPPKATA